MAQRRMIAAKMGGAQAELRTAVLMERQHLVVPVIALVEGVMFASNASGPELVLAEEFGRDIRPWNGRPVVLDHPERNGRHVSANEPTVLEEYFLGQVFHTRVEDKKLKMEAWIDLNRASSVKGAHELIERVNAGEIVDVSVGVFVDAEPEKGTYNGEAYVAVWRDPEPDHLAMLPKGTPGACSVEAGCGTRAASGKEKEMKEGAGKKPKKITKERFAELMQQFRPSQDGTSDVELRASLDEALRAVEPGYLGIDAVFPDDSAVVYAVAPTDSIQLFRRTYTVATDGVAALNDDAEEVKQNVVYEPVSKAATAGCGCKKQVAANKKEEEVVDNAKKTRVAALLARFDKIPALARVLSTKDADVVETFSDDKLKALESQADEAEKPEEPKPEEKPEVKPEPKTETELTEEQKEEAYLKDAPQSIKDTVREAKAARAARKTALVTELKALAKGGYTETELNAMDVPALEKLQRALAAVQPAPKRDFGGAAPPRAASEGGDKGEVPPPPDLTARILKMRGQDAKSKTA